MAVSKRVMVRHFKALPILIGVEVGMHKERVEDAAE